MTVKTPTTTGHLTVVSNGKWWESKVLIDGLLVDVMSVAILVEVGQPCVATVTFEDGTAATFDDVEVTTP